MSIISKEFIQNYVPQYPPFLMVDSLEFVEDKRAVSHFTILSDNILLEAALFSDAGMLENIAQTCALHAGYNFMLSQSRNSSQDSQPVPVGFIGSIKDFCATRWPEIGDTLSTEVIIEHQIGNASVVKGLIYVNKELCASAEMKIFLAEQ